MAEMTDREKEIHYFGIAIEELNTLIKQKSQSLHLPKTDILIDWLELSQSQIDDKYTNVHHQINRVIYFLNSGEVIDNPDKK